jgi:hypothetical protein
MPIPTAWDGMGYCWCIFNCLGYGAGHGHGFKSKSSSSPSPSLSPTTTTIHRQRRNPSPSGTPGTAETSDAGPKPPTATLSRVSMQHYCALRGRLVRLSHFALSFSLASAALSSSLKTRGRKRREQGSWVWQPREGTSGQLRDRAEMACRTAGASSNHDAEKGTWIEERVERTNSVRPTKDRHKSQCRRSLYAMSMSMSLTLTMFGSSLIFFGII